MPDTRTSNKNDNGAAASVASFLSVISNNHRMSSPSVNVVLPQARGGLRIVAAATGLKSEQPVYYPGDPARSFKGSSRSRKTLERLAASIADNPGRTAAMISSKGYSLYGHPRGEGQMLAVMDWACLLWATGMLPKQYDTIICLGADEWDEERASLLDELGIDIVYDDSRELVRFKKKPFSAVGTARLSIVDSWGSGTVRFSREPAGSPEIAATHAYFQAKEFLLACYKAIRDECLKLPINGTYAVPELVSVLSLGRIGVAEPEAPRFMLDEKDVWSPSSRIEFIETKTTFSSRDRKWSNCLWYPSYRELKLLAGAWRSVLVGKTRGGNEKKSPINKELSSILDRSVAVDNEKGRTILSRLEQAGRDAGISDVIAALDAGVPAEDVFA